MTTASPTTKHRASALRWWAQSWALRRTCRQSRPRASWPTRALIFFLLGRCFTKCSRDAAPFLEARPPRPWALSFTRIRNRSTRPRDVYPPPQVLQTNGCFYHSPLPSFLLEFVHNSSASSLHGHYPASLLLLAPPPPSRRPPFSRCRRLYSFLLRGFSPRDEEGFSSCLMRLCHRAAAIAPPERLAASVSLQRSVLPSLPNSEFGPWI